MSDWIPPAAFAAGGVVAFAASLALPGRRLRLVLRVAGGWLLAIAVLAFAAGVLAPPGGDHME